MSRSGRRFRGAAGTGIGCGWVVIVLTVGLVLALFNSAISLGGSIRIPFTSSNVTLAGAIGQKTKIAAALPDYTEGRLGGNQNFVNGTQSLTIGPAEGAVVFVVGRQPGAPIIDLHLLAR